MDMPRKVNPSLVKLQLLIKRLVSRFFRNLLKFGTAANDPRLYQTDSNLPVLINNKNKIINKLEFQWFPQSGSFIHCFQVELEFGNVGFCERRKTGVPGEKPSEIGTRTNNKLYPHMTPRTGIEPGPHWWEASALTTAPSLLP